FRAGEIDLLSNWGVFREGTDVPGITMIVDNAPTDSQPIHAQKIGRGSRPHPDARVDDYQGRDQAAIRRQRIRESPKPFLVYVATFDPTETPLSVPVTLLGRDDIPQAA